MAHIVADRVKETSTTTGTGALTLAGAITGFVPFSQRCSVGDTCYYSLQGVDGSGVPTAEWEVGMGTYSATNILTRTTVLASSNSGSVVTLSAGTKQVYISMPALQVAWARERLTAARTYYVATTGSDSNNGLTVGTPFLTVQKAVDVVAALDIQSTTVTIQVADGTYTAGWVVTGPWLGSGTVVVQGNATTPANVFFNLTGASQVAWAQTGGRFTVKDMRMVNTGTFILLSSTNGAIRFGNISVGACSAQQIRADDGGSIICISNYTISGGAGVHLEAVASGIVRTQNFTATLTGTPAFSSAFAEGVLGGYILATAMSYSGSATGKRYSIASNSVAFTTGANINLFPGDVAGTTATGGQYV